MSLVPATDTPGLWIDPNWQAGHAGTFAVVIGVSRYRHLDDGGEEADDLGKRWIREARRLGQLTVSATTAWRFFRWLMDAYRYPPSPLVRCWLLLAPTELETAHEPALLQHAADPTLAACDAALRSWSASMQRLPAAAQHGSRALLFFSGHGLQVHHDKHLLLPSDYLGGELPNWDDALSTSNLLAGLDSVEIPDRLYFIDACRNDFPEIRAKRPRGRSILTEDETAASYADTRLSAILYATAASLQAWSPVDPSEGMSLFGQAVLEGLEGRPDIELTKHDGMHAVKLGKLHGFAMERVVQILKAHQATVAQRVTLGGPVAHGQVTITEIPQQVLAAVRPGISLDPGGVTRGASQAEWHPTIARSANQRGMELQDLLADALTISRRLTPDIGVALPRAPVDSPGNIPGDPFATQWTAATGAVDAKLFGNKPITDLWTRHSRLLSLSSRVTPGEGQVRVKRVERDVAARSFRITVGGDAGEPRGYWLQVGQSKDTAHAVVLPSLGQAVCYRVEAEIAADGSQVTFLRLEANLSRGNSGLLSEAALLWERYRTADVAEAISRLDLGALRDTVVGKRESPLAATVAALVLLRANRIDLISDWLGNLTEWFPLLPDGAVLRAEQLMREQTDRKLAVSQAAASLCLLHERGLPFTSEAMSYAASLAERLGWTEDLVPAMDRDRLDRVREQISEALVYFRPGGLFTAYAGFDADAAARLMPPVEPGIEHARLE